MSSFRSAFWHLMTSGYTTSSVSRFTGLGKCLRASMLMCFCRLPTEKNANRMEVLYVKDLDEREAISAVQSARRRYWGERISPSEAKEVYDIVGGRLGILNSLAKRKNMLGAAKDRLAQEKQWLLSKIGLIPDHDDGTLHSQSA